MLEVRELSTELATRGGRIRPVDTVSLTVERGATVGVVGESGSGKSMLLRSIMGLLHDDVATLQGSVQLDGQELVGLKRAERRKLWGTKVSIVFQDPLTSLNPVVRVGRQIIESIRTEGPGDKREQAVELMRLVGIPEPGHRLRQYPFQMSGGMRQRIAIAIAIASRPELMLADEPTTALDVTVQSQILDLMGSLQTALHMGMILVSHDLGVIASRADSILVMYCGQVVEQAPTTVLFTQTKSPYTQALMKSIPRTDQPGHTRLDAIKGRPPDLYDVPSGCRFAPRCRYAQDKCRREEPPLMPAAADGHLYRCWFPLAGPDAALVSSTSSAAVGQVP